MECPEEGGSRDRLLVRWLAFKDTAGGYVVLAFAYGLGLTVLTKLVDCEGVPPAWLCPATDKLDTIAQVIPAIVVAIFVFALGAVFVIAQIVIPSRGSRSIGPLYSDTRVQAVVVGGLVLLGGCLLITLASAAELDWRQELAFALVVATALYILLATVLVLWTFMEQISPRGFMLRLTRRPRSRLVLKRYQSWTSDELYTKLRVLRGWLRTVNRAGESRDLQFGLDGVLRLIEYYAEEVRADPHRFERRPKDHEAARCSRLTRAAAGSKQGDPPPWFAYELGRALSRAAESGVRGNTLRRDLDRLLELFRVGVEEFAPKDGARPVLGGEAYMLLMHLTEVALGIRQCEESQRDWFLAPTLLLAKLVTYLEQVEAGAAERIGPECALARTALVGWLLAADAFVQAHPAAGRPDVEDDLLDRCILPGRAESPWEPLTRQEWSALEPDWDVLLESREARHNRLQRLLDKADARRQGQTRLPRAPFRWLGWTRRP